MSVADKKTLALGTFATGLITGSFAYSQYRLFLRKEFQRSEGHYRFSGQITNCTPWKQMYFTWWRMPIEEYNVYHRMKPYFILGQLDMSKEVLIPRKKDGVDGFDVINPLYCYEGGKLSFENQFKGSDPVNIERAAIIVNRGWISAEYRDKRSRPKETNSRELIRMTGVWRRGKNVHEYKVPNNPDNNEWNNLCLEDIGLYWDLPNFDEAKFYYFEKIDLGGRTAEEKNPNSPVQPRVPDELIEDHYGWRWNEGAHQAFFRSFGSVSAISFALSALALAI